MALSTDPLDLAFDDDRDLVVTTDISFVAGAEGVAAQVEERLGAFRGELFFDLERGMPWLPSDTVPESRAILGSRYDAARIRSEVRAMILGTEHVTSVARLEVDRDSTERDVSIDFEAVAAFDDTTVTAEGSALVEV